MCDLMRVVSHVNGSSIYSANKLVDIKVFVHIHVCDVGKKIERHRSK